MSFGHSRLEQLELVNILSISPRAFPFEPLPWKVSAGFNRKPFEEKNALVFDLRPGAGLSYRAAGGQLYALLENPWQVSSRFASGFTTGLGLEGGLIRPLTERRQLRLSLRAAHYPLNREHTEGALKLVQGYRLSPGLQLSLEASLSASPRGQEAEASTGLRFYW